MWSTARASVTLILAWTATAHALRADAVVCRHLPLRHSRLGGAMRLRGGRGGDNFWSTLRELLAEGDAHRPALLVSAWETLDALPPTTRALVVANVAVFLAARVGLLGPTPAERFGFRARDVLAAPSREGHRLLSAAFLHLNRAHIVSNMLVLCGIGSKLESRLGSRRMAALVGFLVPVVGAMQLTVTIVMNAMAAVCGIRDVSRQPLEYARANAMPPKPRRQRLASLIRHQVSVNTISLGFSGVLFALNAVAAQITSEPTMSIRLDLVPYQVRRLVMDYVPHWIDRRGWAPRLALPAGVEPFVHVFLSQLSDPARVSFGGHLAGALAATALAFRGAHLTQLFHGLYLYASRRRLPSFHHARQGGHALDLRQALMGLASLLPLHLATWWLGRRAVHCAALHAWQRGPNDAVLACDWQRALRSLVQRRLHREWGPRDFQRSHDAISSCRGVVDARMIQEQVPVGLWGLDRHRPSTAHQGHGPSLGSMVLLQALRQQVSLHPRNVVRLDALARPRNVDMRVGTVSQVGTCLRQCGEASKFEQRAVTGTRLIHIEHEDLQQMDTLCLEERYRLLTRIHRL